MTTATTSLNFMGADFVAEIDLTIHHLGSKPCTWGSPDNWDPGCDPEYDIYSIMLREERFDPQSRKWLLGPPFEATGALFQTLAASRAIDDAILQTLSEAQSASSYFEDYDDRDYSDRD